MTNLKTTSQLLIALLSGTLLTLAFAPWEYYPLGILSPALLLLTLQNATPKRAFTLGLLFGLGLFTTGVSWIFISIHTYGGTAAWLAAVFTLLFATTLALFPAVQCGLLNRFYPKNTHFKYLIAFPASWVLIEWVRSWFLTGFPWLYLGYTQFTSLLHGYAPIFSVYGLSFFTAFTASALLALITLKQHRATIIATLFVIWIIGGLLTLIQWTRPIGTPISVGIVQGNIAQEIKWDPKQFEQTLETYATLTTPLFREQRLIIWPEAAIPLPDSNIPGFLSQLNTRALQHHATLISGIIEQDVGGNYYNALESFGTEHGHYEKRHLVPFGEYVPLGPLLRGLIAFFDLPMSDLHPGPSLQNALHVGFTTIAPYICYEIAYPELVRGDFPQANFILTVSDDSWFGRSIAQPQHLQIAQMRSLETGRSQIFSTNNGITALIDARGRITQRIPSFKTGVLTGDLQPMMGSTPWIMIGQWPLLGLLFVLFLMGSPVIRWRVRR